MTGETPSSTKTNLTESTFCSETTAFEFPDAETETMDPVDLAPSHSSPWGNLLNCCNPYAGKNKKTKPKPTEINVEPVVDEIEPKVEPVVLQREVLEESPMTVERSETRTEPQSREEETTWNSKPRDAALSDGGDDGVPDLDALGEENHSENQMSREVQEQQMFKAIWNFLLIFVFRNLLGGNAPNNLLTDKEHEEGSRSKNSPPAAAESIEPVPVIS